MVEWWSGVVLELVEASCCQVGVLDSLVHTERQISSTPHLTSIRPLTVLCDYV